MPDINVDLRHGIASIGVDQLDVEVEGNALLVFNNVGTDKFSGNI